MLAFVAQRYDWVGLLAFFLPIALSAYAFRLYVQQMQAQQINDRYGHAAGDVALQYFAALCMASAPPSHLFGRLGGEEFALLLPETDHAGALVIGETIRRHAPATVLTAGGTSFTVTVSIGVATAKTTDQRIEQVLERADQRLYSAKHSGRNCVIGAAVMPDLQAVEESN